MPIYLLIIVQVILGSVLGSQFRGTTISDIYGPVFSGFITTLIVSTAFNISYNFV